MWDFFFSSHVSEGLASEYTQNSYNSAIKRQTAPFKNGQRIWTDMSPEIICKWPVTTQKFVSRHSSPGDVNPIRFASSRVGHDWQNARSQTLCVERLELQALLAGMLRDGGALENWQIFKKLNIESPSDSTLLILDIDASKLKKKHVHPNTCTKCSQQHYS